MAFKHEVTFECDECETQFMIDQDSMELPPGWLGMQVVVSDSEGCIPDHEQEVFCHFCSQTCLMEYAASKEMKKRIIMAENSLLEHDQESQDE